MHKDREESVRDVQEAKAKFCAQHKTTADCCITCVNVEGEPVKWVIYDLEVHQDKVKEYSRSS